MADKDIIANIAVKFILWVLENYNEIEENKFRYKWHTDMNIYTAAELYEKYTLK